MHILTNVLSFELIISYYHLWLCSSHLACFKSYQSAYLTLSNLNLVKPRIAVAILDLWWMKMTWSGWKIKENCNVLVSQFHGYFHSKTLSCREIKFVFRDVIWCFNASRGFKGLGQSIPIYGGRYWIICSALILNSRGQIGEVASSKHRMYHPHGLRQGERTKYDRFVDLNVRGAQRWVYSDLQIYRIWVLFST